MRNNKRAHLLTLDVIFKETNAIKTLNVVQGQTSFEYKKFEFQKG